MLDTLAQSGTIKAAKKVVKPQRVVFGNGSDLCNDQGLKNKAKKKLITTSLMHRLIKIAEARENKEMQKAFWNTYHCHSKLESSGGRSYGMYCKNRFCTVCSGNRKAELIRKYLPELQTWEEPHFVTLTIKARKAASLEKFLKGVDKAFKLVYNRLKQRYKRGKGIKVKGIRSLECNFNPVTKTYNPHLHLIVEGRAAADLLAREWLKTWTKKHAFYQAQNIQQITNREKALIEVIKYGTKIFTEPDPNDKLVNTPRAVYVAAMYNIILAMQKIRLFDRFGFNLPASSRKATKSALAADIVDWEYDMKLNDWTDGRDTKLSGYLPDSKLLAMLTQGVNLDMG